MNVDRTYVVSLQERLGVLRDKNKVVVENNAGLRVQLGGLADNLKTLAARYRELTEKLVSTEAELVVTNESDAFNMNLADRKSAELKRERKEGAEREAILEARIVDIEKQAAGQLSAQEHANMNLLASAAEHANVDQSAVKVETTMVFKFSFSADPAPPPAAAPGSNKRKLLPTMNKPVSITKMASGIFLFPSKRQCNMSLLKKAKKSRK